MITNLAEIPELQRLQAVLRDVAPQKTFALAYSGGVDSRFLAFAAKRLGFEPVLLHIIGPQIAPDETAAALHDAEGMGLEALCVPASSLSMPALAEAGKDRCYVCKRHLFEELIRIGTSPMTPAQVLVDLWPKLQKDCPDTKFQLIPFDNTPENAREILGNLGQNIDVVAGIFDETMLKLRRCAGLELSREPICCAVSIHHRLAQKEQLTIQDLYGEKLMLMRREWSHYVDLLRDDIWKNHPQIHIVDLNFYDVAAFNQCENNNCVLMAVENWRYVHPLLKILPVDWGYTIPFGLLHSPHPSASVKRFLRAVENVVKVL